MANEPAYDATYALSQLLRTHAAQQSTSAKPIDATHALSRAIEAAPTVGVAAPIATSASTAAPTHSYRVEPLTAPKDQKKGKQQ